MLRALATTARVASRIAANQCKLQKCSARLYATVSLELIKTLRQQTGAPLGQVKKALEEEGGDLEKAVQWLRKKGIDTAAKKSGRTASEGLVAVAVHASGKKAAIIELNSETDFVARNEKFQEMAQQLANFALSLPSETTIEQMKLAVLPSSGTSVADSVTELIAAIGENIQLRRVTIVDTSADHDNDNNAVLASYVHNKVTTAANSHIAIGTIGSVVQIKPRSADAAAAAAAEKLSQLATQLAMHVAAMAPQCTSRDEVPQEAIERERNVLREQAKTDGKTKESFLEKIVEGRLSKFFEEIVLADQKWIYDEKSKVSKVLQDAGAQLVTFRRFKVGEGIEKAQVDFAAEVAAQANLKK